MKLLAALALVFSLSAAAAGSPPIPPAVTLTPSATYRPAKAPAPPITPAAPPARLMVYVYHFPIIRH